MEKRHQMIRILNKTKYGTTITITTKSIMEIKSVVRPTHTKKLCKEYIAQPVFFSFSVL